MECGCAEACLEGVVWNVISLDCIMKYKWIESSKKKTVMGKEEEGRGISVTILLIKSTNEIN